MAHSRRRFALSALLLVGIIISVALISIGLEWKRALDDVDAMIVAPVALPRPKGFVKPVAPPVSSSDGNVAAPQVQPAPTPQPTPVPENNEPINILLMGTDTRVGQEAGRTDAMILVHLDSQTGRVSLLSLPRDLWVDIPGFGKNKINTAYPIGERRLGAGYGPALAKETVGNLVGVPVHHFVLINFEGFKTVIDRIGGIAIDVPRAIDDPNYPVDEFEGDMRTMPIHFDVGNQLMNGERALIYARTRHADNDFGRNQRQQQVLMAIFNQVRDQGLLTQLTSLDDYTGALRDYVRTDLSRNHMLHLAKVGTRLDVNNVERYAIGPGMLIGLEQPATFAADPQALKKIVAEMTGVEAQPAGGEGFR